jgi:hypothetical protein
MDIEINAGGRFVKVSGVECEDAADCTKVALDLWRKVKTPDPNLGSAIGFQADKSWQHDHDRGGFVDLGDGFQPVIR